MNDADSEDLARQDSARPEQAMEDNRLRRAFAVEVEAALDADDAERVRALVREMHPADLADLLAQVDKERRAALIEDMGELMTSDVIAELNDWVREEVLELMAPGDVADVVADLDTDDAVALIEDLETDQQQEILQALPEEDRVAIEAALNYPDESAGRIMQRDLVAVPEYWTIGQVIDHLRDNRDLTVEFWEIFVVDAQHRPVGTIKLSWVLRAPRSLAVTDVMAREQTLIPVDMDREEVAFKFQKYGLISAAVVDPDGRLVGMVTVDDMVHVISEEAQKDLLALAGAGEGDINEPIFATARSRLVWLAVNALTAVLASLVISLFEHQIEKLVALAVLMPIVASMGGNAGTQTMTVAVRALATNQLTPTNARRILFKELRVALINGAALAVLIGLAAALWFECWALGAVIGAALIVNIVTAGLAGILVPVTLDKMDVDPAISSSVFVTMTTDVMGFFAFLGLAAVSGLGGICQTCCGG